MDSVIKPSDLQGLNATEQKELMERWFHENYEDPAERTPYESAEGGYIWIWGGPYYARDELENYFHEYADQSVINELTEELERYGWEWAPTERPGDYDDYDYDNFIIGNISSISEAHQNFIGAIGIIETLLETEIASKVQDQFYRLLFVNVVTALETFLSDAFISKVLGNKVLGGQDYFKTFVKSNLDFQNQKFSLSDVLEVVGGLESTVKTHLQEVVWHNLPKVSKMYKTTLGLKFPGKLGEIIKVIHIRHDIVHRNGRNKDGIDIFVQKAEVLALIEKIKQFAQPIDEQLAIIDFPIITTTNE
ncbi:HEPN domain-containing protein [Candidatus Nitrotoga sp. 1052]|uniref:HEPN domain-containing protein n=1 Tax=Candidatus Nitrotoga sp. 1052 TaxID=2886964 RepID=UPI001EF497C0|nr:HEPN domain-containing protein [Candidatus Nitrotoga sp. 1052]CAH1072463.1 conserved hypothetical protein [Candidatus Nitrotoga sp. 1052]